LGVTLGGGGGGHLFLTLVGESERARHEGPHTFALLKEGVCGVFVFLKVFSRRDRNKPIERGKKEGKVQTQTKSQKNEKFNPNSNQMPVGGKKGKGPIQKVVQRGGAVFTTLQNLGKRGEVVINET